MSSSQETSCLPRTTRLDSRLAAPSFLPSLVPQTQGLQSPGLLRSRACSVVPVRRTCPRRQDLQPFTSQATPTCTSPPCLLPPGLESGAGSEGEGGGLQGWVCSLQAWESDPRELAQLPHLVAPQPPHPHSASPPGAGLGACLGLPSLVPPFTATSQLHCS